MSLFKALGCVFIYFFLTVPLATLTPSHLLPRWLLVMLPAAWQEFAWHANELCALCVMTSVSVESVCVSVCVLCVCGAVFTPLRVVRRKHPNLSSHCTVSSSPSAQ